MTYASKYRQNKRLLAAYVNWLEHCTNYEQKLKLSTEIGRLNEQNRMIEHMAYFETQKEIIEYTIEVNAIL